MISVGSFEKAASDKAFAGYGREKNHDPRLKGEAMNHQPFEDWLLNDESLTPIEKRDLDAHIRNCKYCAVLARTGLELRSVEMVSPMPGFTSRFQKRLAARRFADRRRRQWGLIMFLLGGAGLLFWLTARMQFVEAGKVKLDMPFKGTTNLTEWFHERSKR